MGCHGNHAFSHSPNQYFLGTKIFCIWGVPMNTTTPIKSCPRGGGGCKVGQISSRGTWLPTTSPFSTLHSRAFFTSLQDNKILDWSKLKQIEDDILKCKVGQISSRGTWLPTTSPFSTLHSRAFFTSLQDNKILDWSKLKQIEDDILKCI